MTIRDGIPIGLQGCETIYKFQLRFDHIVNFTQFLTHVLYLKIVYLYIISQPCKPIGIPSRIVIFLSYMYPF